jgi:hypothetical protein
MVQDNRGCRLLKPMVFQPRRGFVPRPTTQEKILLADPQAVTVNAIAQSLKRTGMGPNSGSFMTNDGAFKLTVSHNLGSVNQRLIRLDRTQTVANPLTTGEYFETTDSVWLVSRTPKVGTLTVVQQKHLVDGFLAALSASSGALITQILGGEA